MLTEPALAKVNLYLHVVGRRADGYHLLDSLAVFPGAGDLLHATPASSLSLQVTGPHGAGLDAGPDNLVLRAVRALAAAFPVDAGASIILDKRLPVASGIGGGSADAAAALRLLAGVWNLPVTVDRLRVIATSLGADVPVCVGSRPARMQGVGDVLAPAPALPDCGMVLVNPGMEVSTPEVFRGRMGVFSEVARLPPAWPDARAMAADLAECRNDLEPPAIALCPAIRTVLEWLRQQPGCLLARMSGSGATCFGVFPDAATAAAAAARAPVSWWSWGGAMTGVALPVADQAFTDRPCTA